MACAYPNLSSGRSINIKKSLLDFAHLNQEACDVLDIIHMCRRSEMFKAISKVARCACGLSSLLLFDVMSPAFGKDLDVLIRVLYPPFFAEMGAVMCMVPSIKLFDSDRTVFINAHNYAQLIKKKVSTGLNDEDVRFVLKSAAEQARSELREVVRVLKSYPPDREYTELFRWCADNMKTVAEKVVRAYVDEPDVVNRLIENAKHD